ncbi:hypothetical protein ARMGADRAFT_1085821 [Armillaria gallica]|uniref:Uncharacterized protein n=1 Tax=Armillaria gallica TaxID=47427 RepID=A0A2H3CVK0_ARMGA|nr:hypothetical protein ARMGADRAFT_1085821 [Armillaria gallica]
MAQDQKMLQGEDGHQNHEIFHPRRKMVNPDADDEYEFDDEEYSEEFLRRLDKAESDAIAKLKRLEAEADARKKRLADLQEAANHPLSQPFFNPLAGPLSDAASDEDEDLDSQNEAETPRVSRNTGNEPAAQSHNVNDEPGAWFAKPKYMQDWLYRYFAMVIHPLIHNKNGGKILLAPPTFTESKPYAPPTLWIRSPEPVMSLSVHRFQPTLLFRPRVLLWLTLKIHSTLSHGHIIAGRAAKHIFMGGASIF